jgi:hypothetical protein
MAATATPITLDRELVEQFIVEVDALATFNSVLHGNNETWLEQHIYGVLEEFEKAALGPLSDDETQALHDRGVQRGLEVADHFWRQIRSDDA